MVILTASLLHLLVLVYWLGGDLGAFYSSTILTDPKQPAAARTAAARVLNAVDMAPRTCLILAFPTGLTLAVLKGWLSAPWPLVWVLWAAFGVWLVVVWRLHLSHGAAPKGLKSLDMTLRLSALAGFAGGGAAGLLGLWDAPLFIALKMLILAGAVGAGLLIRVFLAPFGPAFVRLATQRPDDEGDAAIARALNLSRPLVVTLWGLLIAAAWLGLAVPA